MNYSEKYLKYKTKYLELKKLLTNDVQTGGANDKNLILFKAEWCGHCKNFLPEWNELQKSDLKNKVNFITYDSDKNSNEIKQWKIDGYPTMYLQQGKNAIEYQGNRTKEEITKFINETKFD
jgi:thiol-disulfide isomerase/thioredoxin